MRPLCCQQCLPSMEKILGSVPYLFSYKGRYFLMIFSCHNIASIIFDVLEARALSSRRKARMLAIAITFSVLETLVAEVGVGRYFFSTSNGSFLSKGPPNSIIILASSFIHSREKGVKGWVNLELSSC